MAKMKLSENTFTLIPEGTATFKVMEVDDSKYEDYGKLLVNLQTAKGEKHTERFTLLKGNGSVNEGALKAWSYFARVCLGDYNADEIDTQDIVGCYITATVKHETYVRTKGEHAGEEATMVRLNNYTTASGFEEDTDNKEVSVDDDTDDLEDLSDLDDLPF